MHLVLVDEQVWTNRYTAEHVRYAAAAWMDMNQGRGKVFYVGGGGGGGSQLLRINITPNRNRKYIAYALSWDCVRQQLAILQMGIQWIHNNVLHSSYIQA